MAQQQAPVIRLNVGMRRPGQPLLLIEQVLVPIDQRRLEHLFDNRRVCTPIRIVTPGGDTRCCVSTDAPAHVPATEPSSEAVPNAPMP